MLKSIAQVFFRFPFMDSEMKPNGFCLRFQYGLAITRYSVNILVPAWPEPVSRLRKALSCHTIRRGQEISLRISITPALYREDLQNPKDL